MNIKSISLGLTGSDILSIIKDYVDVKGLILDSIVLEEGIRLTGSYKKGVRIPFEVCASSGKVQDNVLVLSVNSVKVGKIGIFKWIKNAALKALSKSLKNIGIVLEDESLHININHILKTLPFKMNLIIKDISITDKCLNIDIEEFYFSMTSEQSVEKQVTAIIKEDIEIKKDIITLEAVGKVEDGYTKIRETVGSKVPDKYGNLVDYLMIMPDIMALFFRLFKDKRVPLKTKLIVGGILGYLISPIDILPDFIPFVGKIDDIAIAFFALDKIINEVPRNVILDNWQGKDDIVIKAREGVAYISRAVGGTNVSKLIQFVNKLSSVRAERPSKESTLEKKENA